MLGISAVMVLVSFALVPAMNLQFFPNADRPKVILDLHLPEGTDQAYTAVVAEELGISAHDVYLAKSRVAAKLREIVQRLEREFEESPGEWEAPGARPSAMLGE